MKINLEPGKYVVAISGGVDSVAMLDLLVEQAKSKKQKAKRLELVVVHLDHGMRPDSADDAQFVMELAEKYHLPFVGASIRLGPRASEEEAREQRYAFLRRAASDSGADAIVTAHHQDDVIETAIINTLRGTGRKGLSSLKSTPHLKRPLLHVSKQELINYAKKHNLVWREDSTNQDERYLRNRIRRSLAESLDPHKRANIIRLLDKMHRLNIEIDEAHASLLADQAGTNSLQRRWFASLPHVVALEVLAFWLRGHGLTFDSKTLERLTVDIKTSRVNSQTDVSGGSYILIGKDQISLKSRSLV